MGRGQTHMSTYGHRDSMIESAQWADSMKIGPNWKMLGLKPLCYGLGSYGSLGQPSRLSDNVASRLGQPPHHHPQTPLDEDPA